MMALPIIGNIVDIVGKVLERVIPDPKQKAEALLELQKLEQSGDLAVIAGQIDINKIEAASSNIFVSGWRPFIGWVCGSAFAVQMVLAPMAVWVSQLCGHPVPMVVLDTSLLTTLVTGMLGFGGMRMVERLNGKANGQ